MNLMLLIILFICSYLITYFIRKYALKHNVIDIPNQRSSHTQPTPRGGGMSIVICFLMAIIYIYFADLISLKITFCLIAAGSITAIIGFLDDHQHVPAKLRLLIHFIASAIIVYSVNGLPPIELVGNIYDFGWFGHVFALLLVVWLLNLFNFMDGIDGIAASETIVSTLLMGSLMFFYYNQTGLSYLMWALTVSSLGFLLWNFPPAKIFMGDAGSGFLGLILAALMMVSGDVNQSFLWAWCIILGVFTIDTSFTLVKRVLRGEKFSEAHRSHGYQFASRKFKSHKKVTLGVVAINIFWLAPISTAVVAGYIDGFIGMIIAYIPLIALAVIFKAGDLEPEANQA